MSNITSSKIIDRRNLLKIILIILISIINIFPIYLIFITSVTPSDQILSRSLRLFPDIFTFKNYLNVFERADYVQFVINSIIVGGVTVIITLIVSTLAGYGLTRLWFKGRKIIGKLILFTYLVPTVLLVTPMFMILNNLGLYNTRIGLIVAHVAFSVPYCVWMLMGFFKGLPKGIEQAALVDGATRFQAFYKIILPLAGPGMLAAGIFAFLRSWNEYLYALVLTSETSKMTIPVGMVSVFMGPHMDGSHWATLMAGSILSSIPVIVLFLYFQKYLIKGLASGAVKG